MKQNKHSKKDLAHELGVTRITIVEKLANRVVWRNAELEKIAEIYNVSLNELYAY